jgi:hypothetical protein
MSDHTAATAAPALAAAAGWVDPETDDTDMPVLEESTDTVRPDIREGEGEDVLFFKKKKKKKNGFRKV